MGAGFATARHDTETACKSYLVEQADNPGCR